MHLKFWQSKPHPGTASGDATSTETVNLNPLPAGSDNKRADALPLADLYLDELDFMGRRACWRAAKEAAKVKLR